MLPLHGHGGPPHTLCVSEDWASAQTLCEQLARGSSAPDTHLDLTCAIPVASPGSQLLFLVSEPAPSEGSFGPARVCLQSVKQRVFPSPSFSSVPLLLPGQGSVLLPSTGHKALGPLATTSPPLLLYIHASENSINSRVGRGGVLLSKILSLGRFSKQQSVCCSRASRIQAARPLNCH